MTCIPDDRLLTRYLLRSLSKEETERLDELSIVDDDFAAKLNSAENDLVDAYVRGELPAEDVTRFKAAYLSSPKRRERVRFAETLLSFQQRAMKRPVAIRPSVEESERAESAWARFFGALFGGTRLEGSRSGSPEPSGRWFAPPWALAGVALVLLIASGFLLNTNRELRLRVSQSESERASAVEQEQQLQKQLASRPATGTGDSANETHKTSELSLDRLKVAAFMLAPSLRGSGTLPTISWSAVTDLVVLKLELESAGFSTYRVTIEDSATRNTAWQSADLKPASEGDKQVLAFAFAPSLLKQGSYLVQVTGVRTSGSAELVGSYPFRSVIK